jgi:hypothetical protein
VGSDVHGVTLRDHADSARMADGADAIHLPHRS